MRLPEPAGGAWISMSMLILSQAALYVSQVLDGSLQVFVPANEELSSLVIQASRECAFSGSSIRGTPEAGACFRIPERK